MSESAERRDEELAEVPQKHWMDKRDREAGQQDTLRHYLNTIGRVALLTAEQEVELAKRMEVGWYAEYLLDNPDKNRTDAEIEELEWFVTDAYASRAHMVDANLRLAVSIAKRYNRMPRSLELLDIIQDSNLGLIRATEKFDYTKGFKFSTYATWWLRQSITRAMADTDRLVRLPVHIVDKVNQIKRARNKLENELDRVPTYEEIATQLDKLTAEQVEELLDLDRVALSLDAPIGEEGDVFLKDILHDETAPDPHAYAVAHAQTEIIWSMLDTLTERERLIIKLRHGLEDGTVWKLAEIGARVGLTRERVRQIEKKAMDKLRQRYANGSPEREELIA